MRLAVGLVERRFRSGLDTIVSIVWAVGMALGIFFVALTPGYTPDLMSYLFGSLLFVPWSYVLVVGALDLVILAAVLSAHRLFEAVCFDEEFAEVSGVRVEPVFLGLLALVALAIVTLIRVVGIVLAIALLTICIDHADAVRAKSSIGVLSPRLGREFGLVRTANGLTASRLQAGTNITSDGCRRGS